MNLHLYTVDTWKSGVMVEFGRLSEYADAMLTAGKVEQGVWEHLTGSQLYLVETDGSVDLDYDGEHWAPGIIDYLLLWEWQRGEEE